MRRFWTCALLGAAIAAGWLECSRYRALFNAKDDFVLGHGARVALSHERDAHLNAPWCTPYCPSGVPLAVKLPQQGPWLIYSTVPFLLASRDPLDALRRHSYAWYCAAIAASVWFAVVATESLLAASLLAAGLLVWADLLLAAQGGLCLGGVDAVALCAGSLGFLCDAVRRRRRPSLWLSGVLAGFAAGASPQAIAYLMGWLAAGAWAVRRATLQRRTFLQSAAWAAFGLLPLAWADGMHGGGGWLLGLEHLRYSMHAGLDNVQYGRHWLLRVRQLAAMVSGGYGHPDAESWPLPPLRLLLAAAVGAATLIELGAAFLRDERAGPGALSALIVVVYVALSPFTTSTLNLYHLLPLLPIAFVAVHESLARLAKKGVRSAPWALGLLLWLAWMGQSAMVFAQIRPIRPSDAYNRYKDPYPAARWLAAHAGRRVFVLGDQRLVDATALLRSSAPPAPGIDFVQLPEGSAPAAAAAWMHEIEPGDCFVGAPAGEARALARFAAARGVRWERVTARASPGSSDFEIFRALAVDRSRRNRGVAAAGAHRVY